MARSPETTPQQRGFFRKQPDAGSVNRPIMQEPFSHVSPVSTPEHSNNHSGKSGNSLSLLHEERASLLSQRTQPPPADHAIPVYHHTETQHNNHSRKRNVFLAGAVIGVIGAIAAYKVYEYEKKNDFVHVKTAHKWTQEATGRTPDKGREIYQSISRKTKPETDKAASPDAPVLPAPVVPLDPKHATEPPAAKNPSTPSGHAVPDAKPSTPLPTAPEASREENPSAAHPADVNKNPIEGNAREQTDASNHNQKKMKQRVWERVVSGGKIIARMHEKVSNEASRGVEALGMPDNLSAAKKGVSGRVPTDPDRGNPDAQERAEEWLKLKMQQIQKIPTAVRDWLLPVPKEGVRSAAVTRDPMKQSGALTPFEHTIEAISSSVDPINIHPKEVKPKERRELQINIQVGKESKPRPPFENKIYKNEDALLVMAENKAFGVFDGVGGRAAGEIAAATARDYMEPAFAAISENASEDEAKQTMTQIFEKANETVYRKSQEKKEWKGMGTTASVVKILNNSLAVVGHVGDSRVYHLPKATGVLEPVTLDDGFRDDFPNDEAKALARQKRFANALTFDDVSEDEVDPLLGYFYGGKVNPGQALGITTPLTPRVYSVQLSPGDLLLLTTDGVHDTLTDKEIEAFLKQHAQFPQEAAATLALKAQEYSKMDYEDRIGNPEYRGKMLKRKNDDTSAIVVSLTG